MRMRAVWHLLLAISQACYFICSISQIITLYQVKSARALSDTSLLLGLYANIATLFYVYCLNLPLGYRILQPIQLALFITVICQRLSYEDCNNEKWIRVYFINGLIGILLAPLAYAYPLNFGKYMGAASLLLFSFSQVPQLAKIYFYQDVLGLSYVGICLIGFASFCELVGAFALRLPWQTVAGSVRNIFFAFGCLIAFSLFGQKTCYHES